MIQTRTVTPGTLGSEARASTQAATRLNDYSPTVRWHSATQRPAKAERLRGIPGARSFSYPASWSRLRFKLSARLAAQPCRPDEISPSTAGPTRSRCMSASRLMRRRRSRRTRVCNSLTARSSVV